jgi:tetratricopeptide (TPR) repeat protein
MDGVFLYHRGLDKLKLKAYGEAIRDFNDSLPSDPENTELYYYRGLAHYHLGEYEAAINDFNQVFSRYSVQSSPIEPDLSLSIYLNRGLAHYHLQHYRECLEDLTQVLNLKVNEAQAYYHRGITYLKLGQKQQALNDFHNAAHLFEQQGNCQSYQEIKNILEILSRDHSIDQQN